MEVLTATGGTWEATDLSVANGTAPPASQIIQPQPGSFYYLDSNGQVNGVYPPMNGGSWTGTGELPGNAAATGSPLAGAVTNGVTYLLYLNSSGHMEELSGAGGSWQAILTLASPMGRSRPAPRSFNRPQAPSIIWAATVRSTGRMHQLQTVDPGPGPASFQGRPPPPEAPWPAS